LSGLSALDEKTSPLSMAGPALMLPGSGLRVVSGPDAGREAELIGRTLRVGTAADNDLVLTDPAVSRHHFVMEIEGTRTLIIDAGSTNGTFINGVQVERAIAGLGMRIDIGQTALALIAAQRPVIIPLSARDQFQGLVGRSVAMRELYAMLEKAAASQASVLLHGETGTGKELAAEAIHEASDRAGGPFVVIDCGAIPAALFESELFGHIRGAFTGANHDRQGLLVEAHGGTVFLDEIGELAPELQPKLLRALERRQVRPVGASRPIDIDVRVISATHRDLAAEVDRGTFREDLYYRLAVVRLTLPALRNRLDDLPLLVRLFVERLAPDRRGDVPQLAAQLAHRSFPGNVRELRNAVEELLVLGMRASQIPPHGARPSTPEHVYALPYKEAVERMVELFQRDYVTRLLERTQGNVSRAAREAGMSRRYLQTVISRLGLASGD
jgi:DNA-binding NtrC family response regulator